VRLDAALTVTAAFCPDKLDTFARHLDREWVDEALLATGTATVRSRRLPGQQVVWLVLGMGLMRDRPIVDVVRHLELALPERTSSRSVAPSAVPQARRRVGAAPLAWLFVRSASRWAHESAARHRWRGLALYGVDGSTLRVPDSADNRAYFGGQAAGGQRGESGYPLVRLATLMALRSHVLAAASFGPYGVDERSYAADLWASVPPRSLVIMDRLYLQASVLLPLRRGAEDRHWLSRAKSTTKWEVVRCLGRGDWLVELEVSRAARRQDPSLPRTFEARAIQYQRKGYQPQVLLTSLVDPEQYPADELRALYHERWELELGYDELKTELLQREETIRSKTPEAVAQELWGVLLAFNLIRLEMEQIAEEIGVEPVRVSFVAALRLIVEEWGWATITASPGAIPRHLGDLRDKIRRFILPARRPERVYPRAVKLKMSNYERKRSARRRARPG
jgi:hypothetical protein